MKINWGHKLILVFIIFAVMMSFLVYSSVKTNFELVSKEYYKDEIAFQQVIDGTKLANSLSSRVSIVQENDSVCIRFPLEMQSGLKGQAWFYCPSSAQRDRKIDLELEGSTVQKIARINFLPGKYVVKISWENRGAKYYTEQTIGIQ